MKKIVEGIPLIGLLARGVAALLRRPFFSGSQEYWEARYARGGTSGAGSYGKLAEFKAQVLNSFVKDNGISSVIEFGCGDGNQLALADYPAYIGLDVYNIFFNQTYGEEHFIHGTWDDILKGDYTYGIVTWGDWEGIRKKHNVEHLLRDYVTKPDRQTGLLLLKRLSS